jgi:hypothetical protein
VSTLTPNQTALIDKEKSWLISLTPASLSYRAAMAKLLQAMRVREKETTTTINTTPQINFSQSHTKNQNPIHSRNPNPNPKHHDQRNIKLISSNGQNL